MPIFMETLIKEPSDLRPVEQGVNQRPLGFVDTNGDGIPDNPRGGRTEPELREPVTDDDFGVSNNQSSQDDVNQSESGSDISTDISSSFGEYGTVFADIIKQLEDLFGHGRDTADFVNNDRDGRDDVGNVFSQWMRAISGIADKISGAESANLTSALNQMMSFYMQQISAAMQNQFNVQQWQVQNEYNSPAEQLKRLSQAGLNPLHFFDSGSTGSSTSVTASSGSAPSAASATGDPNQFDRAMGIINSVIGAGSTVANTALAGKEVAMAAAKLPGEIQKQAQDIVESESRVGVNQANKAYLQQKEASEAQTAAFAKELFPTQLKSAYNELLLQESQLDLNDDQLKTNRANRASILQGMAIAAGDFLRNNKLADAQIDETYSKIRLNGAQIKKTLADASYIRTQDDYMKFTSKIAKQTGMPFGTPIIDVLAVKASKTKDPQQLLDALDGIFGIASAQKADIYGHAAVTASLNSKIRSKQVHELFNDIPGKTEETLDLLDSLYNFGYQEFDAYKTQWFQFDNYSKRLEKELKMPVYDIGSTSSW